MHVLRRHVAQFLDQPSHHVTHLTNVFTALVFFSATQGPCPLRLAALKDINPPRRHCRRWLDPHPPFARKSIIRVYLPDYRPKHRIFYLLYGLPRFE
jgi:hypothetical protein